MNSTSTPDFVFNNDGFGILSELDGTDLSERAAVELLVEPLAESGVTAIDWCILTTGEHNCRTRHGRLFDGVGVGREIDRQIGRVVQHYGNGPLDILDIVLKHGHAAGMQVFGNLRINHHLNVDHVVTLPGPTHHECRKDLRHDGFRRYIVEVFEDLLEKGVDGVSLDFERKAEFFPDDVPQSERIAAVTELVREVRSIADPSSSLPENQENATRSPKVRKQCDRTPLIVRVAHEREKGEKQGQDPIAWMREGLIDAVVPATHNHEPDRLDWSFDRFLDAARESPRECKVWPQIWPTGENWGGGVNKRHEPEAVLRRVREIVGAGADGAYFFNYLDHDWTNSDGTPVREMEIFRNLKTT